MVRRCWEPWQRAMKSSMKTSTVQRALSWASKEGRRGGSGTESKGRPTAEEGNREAEGVTTVGGEGTSRGDNFREAEASAAGPEGQR